MFAVLIGLVVSSVLFMLTRHARAVANYTMNNRLVTPWEIPCLPTRCRIGGETCRGAWPK